MTIQVLTEPAIEQSTYAVIAAFTDDAGTALVPNTGTLMWTLLKKVDGVATVVNSKLNVAITSAASVTVVLSGDDLALVVGQSKSRWVLFEGEYNSALGSNLPFKHECVFQILDLVGVPE
jgi:hypothetical protein